MTLKAIGPLVLSGLVIALAVLQFRWSSQLGVAARERMSRDLRVATVSASSAVDLALGRLVGALATAPADTARFRTVLTDWEASHPQLAGLVGEIAGGGPGTRSWRRSGASPALLPAQPLRGAPGSPGLTARFDSLVIARKVLPLLAGEIATAAELEVAVALVYRDSTGAERVVASRGLTGPVGQPDMTVGLLATTGVPRFLFMDSAPREGRLQGTGISWSEAATEPQAISGGAGWELRAWHGSGSLERAAATIRRRNLALGLGLVTLVALVGGMSLLAFWTHQKAADDRATILAGISHEIQTPLAVIRSAADNLRSGVVVGDAVPEYGALIEREVERLSGTVSSAVDFARSISGAGARERVDLNLVAREAIALVENPARIRFQPSEAAWCRVDRRALAIALRNLLANALDYSPPDSPVLLRVGRNGGRAEVVVRDTGPGLEPGEVTRIFEPFARGRAGRESGRSGLGLGLALAQRVARRNGGEITAAREAGSGATFTLSLPVTG